MKIEFKQVFKEKNQKLNLGLNEFWYHNWSNWTIRILVEWSIAFVPVWKVRLGAWLDWWNQACNYIESWPLIRIWINNKNNFGNFGLSALFCIETNSQTFPKIVLHKLDFSDWKLRGRNQASSYDYVNRDFSKLLALFSHYRSMGILMQGREPLIFRWINLVQVVGFGLKPWWRDWTLFCLVVSGLQYQGISILTALLIFGNVRIIEQLRRNVFEMTLYFLTLQKQKWWTSWYQKLEKKFKFMHSFSRFSGVL